MIDTVEAKRTLSLVETRHKELIKLEKDLTVSHECIITTQLS